MHRIHSLQRCSAIIVLLFATRAAAGDDAVAVVGNRTIGAADLAQAVDEALGSGAFFHRISPEKRAALERDKLGELIRLEMARSAAVEAGMPLPVSEAETRRAAIEKQLGSGRYAAALTVRGWSPADHRRKLAERLLSEQAYRCFVVESAGVPESEVRAAYATDAWRRGTPELSHARHILVSVLPGSSAALRAERRSQAGDIVRRLAAGEDFAEIATHASDDPYRVKGGDLGWVHRGRLEEPVESAVWRAAVGDVVGPLESEDGFHIVRVEERRPSRALSYEEAAPGIRKELEGKRLHDVEERWYGQLRARIPVTILDGKLAGDAAP